MSQVHTTKGLIDRDLLEIKLDTKEDANSYAVATEYYLDGELVRRDVAVSLFSGLALAGEQAEMA
jgi:hypothetical protein